MKGAKLYKDEVWHYPDHQGANPQKFCSNPPSNITEIPDCESAEINFLWENEEYYGPYPAHLAVYGTVKTYDHQLAEYLASRYPIEDHQDIGDCLLLYYRTDDGEEWCYRFNGVYFGSGRTMRVYSIKEVDTGESEHSLLTWRLAKFHHGNEPVYWSNWNNRVSLTGSEELTMRRSPVTGGETGLPGIPPGGKGDTVPGASPPGGDTGT